jgi:hypothetical protein
VKNNDITGKDGLSKEELELLIRQKSLDALREISDLIESHENGADKIADEFPKPLSSQREK